VPKPLLERISAPVGQLFADIFVSFLCSLIFWTRSFLYLQHMMVIQLFHAETGSLLLGWN
jgi:hypothetical protein